MRKYFTKLENNQYLTSTQEGHGYEGWLDTSYQPLDIVTNDPQLGSIVTGATVALSNETDTVVSLETLVAGDANADTAERDTCQPLRASALAPENLLLLSVMLRPAMAQRPTLLVSFYYDNFGKRFILISRQMSGPTATLLRSLSTIPKPLAPLVSSSLTASTSTRPAPGAAARLVLLELLLLLAR
jgi:hypothetical protein